MKLFEPGKIGNMLLKNRIVLAAMHTQGLVEPDGRFSQRAIDFYVTRAKGGSGLIITGTVNVTREYDRYPGVPFTDDFILDSNLQVARLYELAMAIHDYGAKVALQLTAGLGRSASVALVNAGQAVAPSAVPCFFKPETMARELSVAEIKQFVSSFRSAAERTRTAGIDAVEIHAVGGYLIDHFMTGLWNKRRDEYGGDLDGRLQFLLQIIDAIKAGAGADFPVIVRYSAKHFMEGGRELDEGIEIARKLENAGVDAIDVTAGCFEAREWGAPSQYHPPGALVELGAQIKKVVKIPVIIVGKLGYPKLAEEVLQQNKADFIALGRGLLADPDWPNKARMGKTEEIIPCIRDGEGCAGYKTGKTLGCAVNPLAGMEGILDIQPAPSARNVVVVGGGPAGMEAARVAAMRGHHVVLYEKNTKLGGNLIPAGVPEFKSEYRMLINYYICQLKKLGIKIELGNEATAGIIKQRNPDVVIVATGSTPLSPDIPGIKNKNVVNALDLLLENKETGNSIAIIGGGAIGCEIGLFLAQKNKRVTVIARHDYGRDLGGTNRAHLIKLLAQLNAVILAYTTVLEITGNSVLVADSNGVKSMVKADTVVIAAGFAPNRALFEELYPVMNEVYMIGDCVEPRKVLEAIREGFRTARII